MSLSGVSSRFMPGKGHGVRHPAQKTLFPCAFLFFIQLCGECALFTVPIQPPVGETYWWKAVLA